MRLVAMIFAAAFVLTGNAQSQQWVYPVGNPDQKPTTAANNANGYQITRTYRFNNHTGVDLSNDLEGGEVRAVADGTIVYVFRTTNANKSDTSAGSGFGNAVIVAHAGGTFSLYAHMRHGSVSVGSVGSSVHSGEKIGEVNCTGYIIVSQPNKGECLSNNQDGSHLHFAIKTLGQLGCAYLNKNECNSEIQYQSTFSIYRDPLDFVEQMRAGSSSPGSKSYQLSGTVESAFHSPGGGSGFFANGVNVGDHFDITLTLATGLPNNQPLAVGQAVYGQFVGQGTPIVSNLRITVNGSTYIADPADLASNSNFVFVFDDSEPNCGPTCDAYELQIVPVPRGGSEWNFGIGYNDPSGAMFNSTAFPITFQKLPDIGFSGTSSDGSFQTWSGKAESVN